MKIPVDMVTGTIHSSNNYGEFKIMSYGGEFNVIIVFLKTGFVTRTSCKSIRSGDIKDRLSPSVMGVGFLGEGNYRSTLNGVHTKAYRAWRGMFERSYGDHEKNNKTYAGCSVCTEWHNFQNFAHWFEQNYIEGNQLDKDIKIEGNKVYSPSACSFVTLAENAVKANAKNYVFVSPLGVTTSVYNLNEFCRKNNLNRGSLNRLNNGKVKQHKGWTKHATC